MAKKIGPFLRATRWQIRYLSAPLCRHETSRKQARNRSKGNLDAPRGPNSPSETAKCDQIPFLQHIYIYKLWSQYVGQVWGFPKSIFWPTLFFSKTIIVKKHYKNRGFNTFLKIKKNARQISKSIFWPTWVFFWDPQLGQNIDFNLAKILTLKMVIFNIFCFLKKC